MAEKQVLGLAWSLPQLYSKNLGKKPRGSVKGQPAEQKPFCGKKKFMLGVDIERGTRDTKGKPSPEGALKVES